MTVSTIPKGVTLSGQHCIGMAMVWFCCVALVLRVWNGNWWACQVAPFQDWGGKKYIEYKA